MWLGWGTEVVDGKAECKFGGNGGGSLQRGKEDDGRIAKDCMMGESWDWRETIK